MPMYNMGGQDALWVPATADTLVTPADGWTEVVSIPPDTELEAGMYIFVLSVTYCVKDVVATHLHWRVGGGPNVTTYSTTGHEVDEIFPVTKTAIVPWAGGIITSAVEFDIGGIGSSVDVTSASIMMTRLGDYPF